MLLNPEALVAAKYASKPSNIAFPIYALPILALPPCAAVAPADWRAKSEPVFIPACMFSRSLAITPAANPSLATPITPVPINRLVAPIVWARNGILIAVTSVSQATALSAAHSKDLLSEYFIVPAVASWLMYVLVEVIEYVKGPTFS